MNVTGCPFTSWVCAEVTAAAVSGRNGSLVSNRCTPVEISERMPFATVSRGEWHHLEAGTDGATITVAMLGGTKLMREDGSETVPPWVS